MTAQKQKAPLDQVTPAPVFALEAKQARSRQLRDKALVLAAELVRKGQFDATSMVELAKSAGCSVGALYFRFRDKEALFASVIEVTMRHEVEVLKVLDKAGRYQGQALNETVDRCIRDFVAFIENNDAMIRAMYLRSTVQPGYWGVVRSAVFDMVQVWIAAVAVAANRGKDSDYLRQVGIAFQFVSSTLVYSVLIDSPVRPLGKRELVYWLNEMLLHFIALDVPTDFKPVPALVPQSLAAPPAVPARRKKV
ncbi:TetR/AcrR family transcriptional regulator [Delftia tsuruhatensis]|uniref:HTH tetR-type domain-containing protein n=1 Tax=Delftia tsuruhatensis TaxID=180282 RepID=A0ABN4SRL1_9BURK|nr:TetR/AcrR family transcriptional regulator [Delftia tsuruhatensis]AOV05338.1 hypothetical protein BI380_30415 [Delftia tsuruhatensis]